MKFPIHFEMEEDIADEHLRAHILKMLFCYSTLAELPPELEMQTKLWHESLSNSLSDLLFDVMHGQLTVMIETIALLPFVNLELTPEIEQQISEFTEHSKSVFGGRKKNEQD